MYVQYTAKIRIKRKSKNATIVASGMQTIKCHHNPVVLNVMVVCVGNGILWFLYEPTYTQGCMEFKLRPSGWDTAEITCLI